MGTSVRLAVLQNCSKPVSLFHVGTSVLLAVLQIKSVDYQYRDGQSVQSTRLPGYSGVSGLDDYDSAEDAKAHADLESVRWDMHYSSALRCTDGAEKQEKTTPFRDNLMKTMVVFRAALRCRISLMAK